jgi:hypothetical protein
VHANINPVLSRTAAPLLALACALSLGALVGCGGAANEPARPVPPPASHPTEPELPAALPTAGECDALVAHAIELVEHEYPDGTRLSTADRANLRALADARCRDQSRANLACALAATTADAFVACDGAQAASSR